MSKTNDTFRELTSNELDGVSGGADYITHSIDTPSISGDGGGGGLSDAMIKYGRAVAGANTHT